MITPLATFSNPPVYSREAVESGKNGLVCVLDAKNLQATARLLADFDLRLTYFAIIVRVQ
jgi:hypothetical protein